MKPVSSSATPLGHGVMPLGRGETPLGPATPAGRSTPLDAPHGPQANERARLRGLAKQLEGVFMTQLFKAMRETVPQNGLGETSSGEQTFTSMLDEKIADQAAARMSGGVSEALVRQLARASQDRHATGAPAATVSPLHPGPARPVSLVPHANPMSLAPRPEPQP